MAKSIQSKSAKKRVRVGKLSTAKTLSVKSARKVKGGIVQGNYIGTDKAVTVGDSQQETVGKIK
jgi:hypothetical protein